MSQPTLYQAITSGLVGGVGMATYLVVSYLVDYKYSYDTSNLIGLVVSSVVDFYLQQMVFVGKMTSNFSFIWKYALVRVLEIVLAQVMFNRYIAYIQRHKPHFFHYKMGSRVLVARYAIQMIIFALITFPMRKFVIYV